MLEQYTKDILQSIKDSPIDWQAISNTWGDFDGIIHLKNRNQIEHLYFSEARLRIKGTRMPLSFQSRRLLKKAVKDWQQNVPALHLQGDIAVITDDTSDLQGRGIGHD